MDIEQPKKAYANVQARRVLNIDQFAEHITSHGCVYNRADISAILVMAVDCIKEQILEGNAVELGELGKFSPRITGKGAKDFETYNANANIKTLTIKWKPGVGLKNLKDKAEFERVLTREDEAKAKKEVYGK